MRKCRRCFIIILVLFISIGFAVLTTNLGIVSNLTFRDNTFDVHFERAEISASSTSINNIVNINDTTTISFSTTLTKPTDYIEFTFYVVNSGTVDAQLNSITTNLTTEQNNYINYSFHYDKDDVVVNLNDYLYRGQARKIKAHFEYNYDIDNLYSSEELSITLTLKYIQPEKVTTVVWDYDYSGTEQYFIIPKTGNYKLEVWGGQGGSLKGVVYSSGYGGYATGQIRLNKNQKLYINVAGMGESGNIKNDSAQFGGKGGYNGGGNGSIGYNLSFPGGAGGGGATHIATISGLLSTLEDKKDSILIVAGGGGGASHSSVLLGGSGGGFEGAANSRSDGNMEVYNYPVCLGGTQDSGYQFGLGQNGRAAVGGNNGCEGNGGGGGGWYGGTSTQSTSSYSNSAGGGGSGYIGNNNLSNKIMYCYNCQESTNEADETNIKTRSTTNVSQSPISQYAKIGNGYARITYLG